MSIYRNHQSSGSWSELFVDIYSGIAVGIGHPKWFIENTIDKGWKAILALSGSSSTANQKQSHTDNDTKDSLSNQGLKVVGVGYGRTGTYSLALALYELGFHTLHTQHLYENGEIFDHLTNNIFYKSIQNNEVIMGEPNLDLLLKAGYSATMDLPFALYFNQILEKYPECKFILTVRPSEDWFRSWEVLTNSITQPAQYTSFIFTHVKKLEYYMRWLFSVVNSDKTFLSHPFPLPPQNKQNAISSYEKHNQLVRDSIPESQLLEYNVRQGWDPLCEFLQISKEECPSTNDIPFPKSNSARAVKWQSYSAFIGPLILTLFILSSLLAFVFRKIVGMPCVTWCRIQVKKRRESRFKVD